ncbi:MAG: hypothetical protein AAF934_09600, partial [Bacteroidota bacterium]
TDFENLRGLFLEKGSKKTVMIPPNLMYNFKSVGSDCRKPGRIRQRRRRKRPKPKNASDEFIAFIWYNFPIFSTFATQIFFGQIP